MQKRLKKLPNNEKNRKKLVENLEKIEEILFVEDLVSIQFTNKSHYLAILKKGCFFINGIRFTPFMASAGMIRRNTALFINNNIKHPLMDILENGRNTSVPMVAAKFGAYFSLYSSSSLPVSFPNMVVVPDKTIEKVETVDFVTYKGIDEDDSVETRTTPIKLNAWDGQGLISPRLALKWSDELELNYTFSCAIIRAPFTKGLVVVFDFHKFAEKIAQKDTITDIYGVVHNIRDIDLIISESMFKLYDAYENAEDYIKKCKENGLGFSITKVNLKKEKSCSRTSYQFLQVLNLGEGEVAQLCEPTINWFRDISGNSPQNILLYATGEHEFNLKEFDKLDISVKAILINPNLSKDKYIQNRFIKTITKKKKESYMGSLMINANYQFMIADPYYQACHIFNIDLPPLLKEGEHYSEYWLDRGIRIVGAIRSPIVHHSEFNVLSFQDREDTKKWYEHIHSGIIFPANGIGLDCAIHGGADFDGDLVCTINNEIMLRSRIPGIPIVYESQKAEKTIVDSRDDKAQVENQLNGYNSKVGFATNISSSFYTMLEEFPMGSEEKDTILKRLKIGRVIQGEIIDGVKGLKVPPFREHWTKFTKITENMTPEETEKWTLYNKIVCNIRPAYFRFLYSHYMTRYNKEIKKYNVYTHMMLKKSFSDILKTRNRTPEEEEIVQMYKKSSYFLDNNSTVNRISRYMRANVGLIGKYSMRSSKNFNYTVLQGNFELDPGQIVRIREYLDEYKAFKKNMRFDPSPYSNLDAFVSGLRKKCYANISTNEAELASYAVEVAYGGKSTMQEFPWKMFPNGIIENIMEKSNGIIRMPIEDPYGEIEYLWNRYTIKEFSLGDLYEK